VLPSIDASHLGCWIKVNPWHQSMICAVVMYVETQLWFSLAVMCNRCYLKGMVVRFVKVGVICDNFATHEW
jgi:hypothetical protein